MRRRLLIYVVALFLPFQSIAHGIRTSDLGYAEIESATVVSSKRIDLVFEDPELEIETVIYVSENGVDFEEVATVNTLDFTFWGRPETTYYFKIRHTDGELFSEYSDVVDVTTIKKPSIIGDDVGDIEENESFIIGHADLTVEDAPGFPTGYTIQIKDGNHYSVENDDTVVPDEDYAGELEMDVRIITAVDSSAYYTITINVTTFHPPKITGLVPMNCHEDVAFELTLNELLVAHAPGFPDAYSLIITPSPSFTIVGNQLSTPEDFSGTLSVELRITNGSETSDPFMAEIEINSVDDPFKPFPLIFPEDGAETGNIITFIWMPATDVDNSEDPEYKIELLGTTTKTFTGITTNSFELSIFEIPEFWNQVISWRVTASNNTGQLTTETSSMIIVFTKPEIVASDELSTDEDVPIKVELSNLTVENAPDYPTGYKLHLKDGPYYTVMDQIVTTDTNFFGDTQISVRVSIGNDTSDYFFIPLHVASVNDVPTPFNLLTPLDKESISGMVNFTWQPSTDDDGDAVSYQLKITYPGGDVIYDNLPSVGLQFDPSKYPGLLGKNVLWKVTAKDTNGGVRESTQQYSFIVPVTGIEEHLDGSSLYPNPARDKVYIRNLFGGSPTQLSIVNMHGAIAHTESISDGPETVVDISTYAPGLYIVLFSGSGEMRAMRFVKE